MSKFSTFGVDVCLSALSDVDNPCCPHGPAILFERYTPGGSNSSVDRFYACSASRDRKLCSFYMRADDKDLQKEAKTNVRQQYNEKLQPKLSHGQYLSKMSQLKSLPVSSRQFCLDCGLVLLPDERSKHSAHNVKDTDLIDSLLDTPTQLLLPLENKKTNAQYLFGNKTVQFIVSTVKRLQYTKVLCVGAPRIHEEIQRCEPQLQSLLLDIDHRYMQFYAPDKFLRYNMFNNHLFDGNKAKKMLRSFLLQDTGPVLLVTDPPFGGLAELLAYSIQQTNKLWKQTNSTDIGSLPVMWFFPYYLEAKVLSATQGYTMLDYKVEYDNHSAFKNNKTPGQSKHGSAVRIFTNIDPGKIVLPKEEGYRLCKRCCRYVSKENQHCDRCKACTSKDGRTYVHCVPCGRCVKPNKTHCATCNVCDIPDRHKCGGLKLPGCHICGSHDHKRRECPKREDNVTGKKTNGSVPEKFKATKKAKKRKHRKDIEVIDNKTDGTPVEDSNNTEAVNITEKITAKKRKVEKQSDVNGVKKTESLTADGNNVKKLTRKSKKMKKHKKRSQSKNKP